MAQLSTTKMSTKGQVVIPEEIRERLGLRAGTQFVVVGEDDTVVLKAIQPPAMSKFSKLLKQAQSSAKQASLSEDDVEVAIKASRLSK